MARLILASSSPRRKELLKMIYNNFEIISSNVDETITENLSPEQMVIELALRKARVISQHHQDAFVIGADTIVVLGDQILGKPKDKQEAKQMLQTLSGKTHNVVTGVAVLHGNLTKTFHVKTEVTFWKLTEVEIEDYISTNEPLDKAGSYGIQGFGSTLVQSIRGDFFSVVGLPISHLYRVLQSMGYSQ